MRFFPFSMHGQTVTRPVFLPPRCRLHNEKTFPISSLVSVGRAAAAAAAHTQKHAVHRLCAGQIHHFIMILAFLFYVLLLRWIFCFPIFNARLHTVPKKESREAPQHTQEEKTKLKLKNAAVTRFVCRLASTIRFVRKILFMCLKQRERTTFLV